MDNTISDLPDKVTDMLIKLYKAGKTQKQMVAVVNEKYGDGTVTPDVVRRFFKKYAWIKKRWNWDKRKAQELSVRR